QRIAVPGDHPYRQVRAGGRQPGRDRGGAAVDRVHAVAVHVVRQPGGAADAGDDDEVLPRHLQFRQERLERGQDGGVAAPGAPAHFLVGLEVLGGQLLVGDRDQREGPQPVGGVPGAVVGGATGAVVCVT